MGLRYCSVEANYRQRLHNLSATAELLDMYVHTWLYVAIKMLKPFRSSALSSSVTISTTTNYKRHDVVLHIHYNPNFLPFPFLIVVTTMIIQLSFEIKTSKNSQTYNQKTHLQTCLLHL